MAEVKEETSWLKMGLELRNLMVGQRNYTNFLITTPTPPGPPDEIEGFELLLLRLKIDANFSEEFKAQLHFVQQSLLRTYAMPVGFSGYSVNGGNSLYQVNDFQYEIIDDSSLTLNLFPDRALILWQRQDFSLSVGRQAASFGKTFFWNPLDWLSPFTPATIDRTYKPGVDLVRIDLWLSSRSSLALIYGFGDQADFDESATMVAFTFSLPDYDFDGLLGRLKQEWRLGYGFSATPQYLLGRALRGKLALHLPDHSHTSTYDNNFIRSTVSYDYALPNSLTFLAEYHSNGLGGNKPYQYVMVATDPHLLSGEISNFSEHYLAERLAYDITPLFKGNFALMHNLNDASLALLPAISYSLADEVDMNLSGFFPFGERPDLAGFRSEFGTYPSFLSLELTAVF